MTLSRIDVVAYRVPSELPVATSFGIMRDRPAVFVRLTDAGGAFGWGEIFANWPAAGAEHRARLLVEDMADVVFAAPTETLAGFTAFLTDATRIRAIQCAEPGPFRQVIAGLDTALADLMARRAGLPLARWLTPDAAGRVPAYASGIAVSQAEVRIADARARGFTAFKVKVGFDHRADISGLRSVTGDIGPGGRLFADANQAWDLSRATAFMADADAFGLGWMEEPLRADAAPGDWAALAARSSTPLAAGENIAGDAEFAAAIAGPLAFVQPDVAKWGGVSGCFAVARTAVAAGKTYCPHFLGGGIGLHASAHLLAAASGPGLLEVDINANPLRDAFGMPLSASNWHVSDSPGLGIEGIPPALAPYQTLALSVSAP